MGALGGDQEMVMLSVVTVETSDCTGPRAVCVVCVCVHTRTCVHACVRACVRACACGREREKNPMTAACYVMVY